MKVDEGSGVARRLIQQQKTCCIETGRWGQQKRHQMTGTADNKDGKIEERQQVQLQQRFRRKREGILGGRTSTVSCSSERKRRLK